MSLINLKETLPPNCNIDGREMKLCILQLFNIDAFVHYITLENHPLIYLAKEKGQFLHKQE